MEPVREAPTDSPSASPTRTVNEDEGRQSLAPTQQIGKMSDPSLSPSELVSMVPSPFTANNTATMTPDVPNTVTLSIAPAAGLANVATNAPLLARRPASVNQNATNETSDARGTFFDVLYTISLLGASLLTFITS